MFPLRDTIRSRHLPIMTWTILVVNTLVFLFELTLGPRDLFQFMNSFAMIPADLLYGRVEFFMDVVTSMFLHAGWFHFLSNMWILFIFGDNVEDRMGSFTFLFFYLLSGFAAGILQTLVSPASTVPTLGASGAIAGVLGAYLVLFPAARVITLIPVLLFPLIVRIPAVFYLGIWFVSQLFSGVASIATGMGGVAWWAHIGGFLFGLFLGRFFQLRPPPPAPGTFRVYDMHEDEYPWR